ncbi:MAG TPA: hypothetical protein GXZ85_10665 [Firmicutes bacterium]|jgi:hypothetical protein|nr:hypothetical protein [Bacillota bacterium]
MQQIKSQLLAKYVLLVITGLLTLTLFDSNPWWKVLIYALPATILNTILTNTSALRSWPLVFIGVIQGLTAALLFYLLSLTGFFRATFGTLLGFALLILLTEYLLTRFFPPTSN